MRADLTHLDHKYRARRSAQTPAEYAAAIERYRRRASLPTRAAIALSIVLLLAAAVLKGMP